MADRRAQGWPAVASSGTTGASSSPGTQKPWDNRPSLSARQKPGVGRELGQGDRAVPEGLAPFLPLRLVPHRRLLGR